MARIRLTIAYDGRGYHGWQVQPDAVTIQGTIQRVLAGMHGGWGVPLTGAGRTDSGVHALAQGAHFDSDLALDGATWAKALNAQLPPDIVVKRSQVVADDFHARHSAIGKHYRYRVLNRRVRSPFRHGFSWYRPYPLAVADMAREAQYFVGTHDFTSLRATGCGASHPVRTVERITVERQGDEVVFDVFGQGFLKQMVRNLVGTLMEVGRGNRPEAWVREVLAARDRCRAGETAPAHGLTLVAVRYP